MLRFYRDALGLVPAGSNPVPGGTLDRLQCGASSIKLLSYDELPPKHPGGVDVALGYRLLTITVPDIDVMSRRLADRGFAPLRYRRTDPYNISLLNDPDGNLLEIVSRLDRRFTTELAAVGATVSSADRTRSFFEQLDVGRPTPIGNYLRSVGPPSATPS